VAARVTLTASASHPPGVGRGDQAGDQRHNQHRGRRLRHRPGPLAPHSGRL